MHECHKSITSALAAIYKSLKSFTITHITSDYSVASSSIISQISSLVY